MTREEVRNVLPILQAFAEGKSIETKCCLGEVWVEEDEFYYDPDFEYHIKTDSE